MKLSPLLRTKIIHLPVYVVPLLFLSCSSSRLSNMWRDPSYNGGPIRSMLVIAVKGNPAIRRIWEDGIASALSMHGVVVTTSYQIFPDHLPDTVQVVQAVKDKGIEGVLTVSRLPTMTHTDYVEGYVTSKPVSHYSEWHRAYYVHYEEEYHPGYTDTTRIVRHEIDVWTTKGDGHMIWSGTGEVLDPSSSKAVNNEIVNLIVPELTKQGIVGPPAK